MSSAAAKIAARLADLWRTSQPSILERMAALRAAQIALFADPEDQHARSSGREAAHKLSGVLGIFGLPRGSEIAFELEQILKGEQPLTQESLATLADRVRELDTVIASRPEA